ncbi:uncharacterized protein [Leptinotarsa decemlineata]|uniref:uncharacterized protein n=1 Tax=Leptinotarsa decemlineata TaxID=7539 RepID=UPI003D30746D
MSDFQNLNLQGEPSMVCLRDYGGGSVSVRTKVPITLAVDLAIANVESLVFPDNVQNVSMIVEQPFINHENVTVVVQCSQIRLFNHSQNVSLDSSKLPVMARPISHILPRCVTNASSGGYLPIMNISVRDVCYKKGRVVARGVTCFADTSILLLTCMQTGIKNLKPLTLADIENQLNPNLTVHEKEIFLSFLNEYRGCFALTLDEVGRTNVTEMTIKLSDDVPVTYCPYRMAYTEREK